MVLWASMCVHMSGALYSKTRRFACVFMRILEACACICAPLALQTSKEHEDTSRSAWGSILILTHAVSVLIPLSYIAPSWHKIAFCQCAYTTKLHRSV